MYQKPPLCTSTGLHTIDDHCEPKSPVEIKRPQIALRRVVRSVVSQVPSCTGAVFERATPQHNNLFSRLRNNTCPYFDQSRSHLPCCDHSWAEQTTGPRTVWPRVSMRVSYQMDTCEARIRAGDKEEKHIHVPVRIHTRSFHREVTVCEAEALI